MDNRNRLLAALSTDEYARLSPQLCTAALELGTVLEPRHEQATFVYFPWDGVCSLTTVMLDGTRRGRSPCCRIPRADPPQWLWLLSRVPGDG